ncbi:hypothetical protein K8O93_01110 [Gordonia bronchialis]|uniref:hypothetical protein n=1 Tax=Gordonia bronchialis TaxID=2054 RepID=UPI001CBFEE1D|nr:hypothetical protein [Gordonia bronchialis]UAK38433.1 hypothetical protein K8O93_01110 [Gordonia bronchialis]
MIPLDDSAISLIKHALDAVCDVDDEGNHHNVGSDMTLSQLLESWSQDVLAGVDDVGFCAFVDVDGVVRTETAKSHTRAVVPTPSEPRLCAGQEFATPDRNPLQSALSGITALREVFEELFSDSRPGETSDELSATSGFVAPGGRDGV